MQKIGLSGPGEMGFTLRCANFTRIRNHDLSVSSFFGRISFASNPLSSFTEGAKGTDEFF